MFGLAIRQPYASLIAFGARTLVLSAKPVTYRGGVVIVGVRPSTERDTLERLIHEKPASYFLEPYGYDGLDEMPTGVAVARGFVAGCLSRNDRVVRAALARHPFEASLLPIEPRKEWAVILTHIESIKPEVRVTPNYGLFRVDPDTVGRILAAPLI